MTTTRPVLPAVRRLRGAVLLLGSPYDGEAVGAARAVECALSGAGMTLHDLAALIEREMVRRQAPAFIFAAAGPRAARNLIAHLARLPAASLADRARLKVLRECLHSGVPLGADDVAWLDGLWHGPHGTAACA